jgi:hypothetical protein
VFDGGVVVVAVIAMVVGGMRWGLVSVTNTVTCNFFKIYCELRPVIWLIEPRAKKNLVTYSMTI